MKAKCINNIGWQYKGQWIKKYWWSKKKKKPADGPKLNDIVTITSEYWENGIKYYRLLEWPIGGYDYNFFILIEEEYEKVTFSQIKEKASAN